MGRWGCPGGSKNIFFKHGHVAYQIDIKFRLPCQFHFLYQTLRVLSQIKDRNYIEQNHAPRTGLGGAGGVKNFSLGTCDGAPSTMHSSCFSFRIKWWLSGLELTKCFTEWQTEKIFFRRSLVWVCPTSV